jgi:hypothetical protein
MASKSASGLSKPMIGKIDGGFWPPKFDSYKRKYLISGKIVFTVGTTLPS